MYKYFTYIALILSFNATAQPCDCKNTIQAVITSIETNYAGYNDKIKDVIGKYNVLKANLLKSSLKIDSFDYNCFNILKKYISFFDEPHLYTSFNSKEFPEEVRKIFSKKFPVLNPIETKNKFPNGLLEDYWIDDTKRYTIKLVQIKKNNFVGYITKGDSLYWYKNQIKLKIQRTKNNIYNATYFLRDHTKKTAVVLLMKDEFKVGRFVRFTRIKVDNLIERPKFEFKVLNNRFCYLKIPNFFVGNINIIDSLITANKENIESTHNLIIDLRNNAGGSNLIFSKILPYLYTNTFIKDGYSIRSSQNNIQEYSKYSSDTTFPKSVRASFAKILEKLDATPDTLVEIVSSTEIKFDSIYTNPTKIFLLINEKCASTTEQLLMYAKQSKKTIILGNPTAGSFDYNDINSSTILPCNFLKLSYPMSRSNRLNKNKSKNSQITPDIELNIPDEEWVDYVIKKYY